jgi:hypothetical protein
MRDEPSNYFRDRWSTCKSNMLNSKTGPVRVTFVTQWFQSGERRPVIRLSSLVDELRNGTGSNTGLKISEVYLAKRWPKFGNC